MEIIIFFIGLGLLFLPLVFAGSLLRDGTPARVVIGQTMILALMIGAILQVAVGGDAHFGVSLLVLPFYVGTNFILLMITLTLRAVGEASRTDVAQSVEQPLVRKEHETLLLKSEEQNGA